MASSKATTVAAYLRELPPERRVALSQVRDVVRENLPDGYEEMMLWGMITYAIPTARLADTYNKQPLCYAALAAQKNYNSLYLMSVYATDRTAREFADGFRKAGKKLDMGKSCIRFKSADDLPLEHIATTIASTPADKWIDVYERSRAKPAQGGRSGAASAARKTSASKKPSPRKNAAAKKTSAKARRAAG
jgi:hypothetical protein